MSDNDRKSTLLNKLNEFFFLERRPNPKNFCYLQGTLRKGPSRISTKLLYYRECYKKQLKNKFSCHRQCYKPLLIKVVTNMISSEKVFIAKRFITPTANNEEN